MSNILISGCGVSFSKQRKPTWSKVLKICGANITDLGGPAVSNEYILNKLLYGLHSHQDVTHVICQLTTTGKLDVEVNAHRQQLVINDPIRNFTFDGIWPSSVSKTSRIKRDYYEWLYSEKIDIDNTIIKLLALKQYCMTNKIKLLILQGYQIDWPPDNPILGHLPIDFDYVIYDEYKNSEYYQYHDHDNGNTVPCKEYQKYLAQKINSDFLHLDLDHKFKKFL